eukprot:2111323-Pyramimonas_sp.AAC.1
MHTILCPKYYRARRNDMLIRRLTDNRHFAPAYPLRPRLRSTAHSPALSRYRAYVRNAREQGLSKDDPHPVASSHASRVVPRTFPPCYCSREQSSRVENVATVQHNSLVALLALLLQSDTEHTAALNAGGPVSRRSPRSPLRVRVLGHLLVDGS